MDMKKKKIIILSVVGGVILSLSLSLIIPFAIIGINTNNIKNDYHYLRDDIKYKDKVEITDLELVTQHVSCGYATIEMISTYYGHKVSEDDLDNKNSSISTSSSKGFLNEINESITNKAFVMETYLKNDEMLIHIYNSLHNNNPIAIEWAAKYEGEWTLHFSIVSGLDIINNNVTIYNPYGYIENINIEEFVNRTTFEAYDNMPLFLNFGFAFGAFHKNTIFYAQ